MARNFDGVDDDIVVTGNSGLNLGTGDFTIACWINFDAIDTDGSRVVEQGSDSIALSPQVYFASTTVLKLTFQIGNDFGGRVQHATALTVGTDYFISVRRNSSNLVEVDVWDVNLAKVGSTASATKTDDLSPASGNLNIGKDAAFAATTRWNGDLAHLWWIKARLNDNELKGIAFTSKPLTANYRHWPLWGLDSPEPDLSGNGDDGTVTEAIRSNHPPITLFTPKWAAAAPLIEAAVGVHAGALVSTIPLKSKLQGLVA